MAKRNVNTKTNLFIADLGNLKLTAAQQKAIASGIQETIMLELAQLDLGGIVTTKPPRKWELQGIIVRPADSIPGLESILGNSPIG